MTQHNTETLLAALSLKEKCKLLSGDGYWHTAPLPQHNLPRIQVADGPHGLRKQPQGPPKPGIMESLPATCFPTAAALACSWDVELLEQVGQAMGREAVAADIALILGPGANLKRDPRGGRNFEYFSEDPYLSGIMAGAIIRGIQSTGVGACLKHFVANNQEHQRQVTNVLIPKRALHELYLESFRIAIASSQPKSIMTAYNRVNGEYCSEHTELLQKTLRKEWSFDGLIISDWGATNDRIAGLRNGLDLEMPGSAGAWQTQLKKALAEGNVTETHIDAAAARVLSLVTQAPKNIGPIDQSQHHAIARHAATNSIVLLQHDPDVLPLAPQGSIAVIGAYARQPRYQGNGSSRVNPTKLDTPWDCLWSELKGQSVSLGYAAGYAPMSTREDQSLIEEAVAVAKQADKVVLFVGLPEVLESEAIDRLHLRLPAQQIALIEAIANVHKQICVIIQSGSPIVMPWRKKVQAIMTGYLSGQAAGSALVDVLFGRACPSGKLAESFPLEIDDCPTATIFPGQNKQVQHRESIYVGYRYYDTAQKDVLFPFGHGLSYAHFAYNWEEKPKVNISYPGADSLDAIAMTLSCRVSNESTTKGAEIAQLYIHHTDSHIERPTQSLAGFAKLNLTPDGSGVARFAVTWRQLAFFDEQSDCWQVSPGTCELRVGSSSRDIRLTATCKVTSDFQFDGTKRNRYWEPAKDESAFAALYNRPLPAEAPHTPFHPNSTLGEAASHSKGFSRNLGRLILWLAKREAKKALPEPEHKAFLEALLHSMEHTPLRSMVLMSEGRVRFHHLQGILDILNGKWRKGLNAMRTKS